jgi:glutathione S-transferase
MLKLHFSPGACSLATHIILEEIGEPFTARAVPIREGATQTAEFLALNPHGRVPVLEADGQVITESVAILTYLGLRFPSSGVLPLHDLRLTARALELLAFFASSVHIAVAQVWRSHRFAADEAAYPTVQASGHANLRSFFDEIETMAASGDWVLGDLFSVADPYLLVFYRWGWMLGLDMASYRAWTTHTDRMLARPAVMRALDREGIDIAAIRR